MSDTHIKGLAEQIVEQCQYGASISDIVSILSAHIPAYKALQEEVERLNLALTPKPPREGIYPWAVPLEKTKQHAEYWLQGGAKKCDNHDAIVCMTQASYSWMNCAYHYAEKAYNFEERIATLSAANSAQAEQLLALQTGGEVYAYEVPLSSGKGSELVFADWYRRTGEEVPERAIPLYTAAPAIKQQVAGEVPMNLGECIAHVGGVVTDAGRVEFGSVMAVKAMIHHFVKGGTINAWQHELRPAHVISAEVKELWLKVNPKHVEHYTVPLTIATTTHPVSANQPDGGKVDHNKLTRFDCFEVTRTRFGETETEAVMKESKRGPYVLFDDVEELLSYPKASAERG